MGCSSSQVSETSHTIIKGTLQKNISVSTSYNPNKYLSLNPIYYKNQAPSIPFNDNIFPPNLDSYLGKETNLVGILALYLITYGSKIAFVLP